MFLFKIIINIFIIINIIPFYFTQISKVFPIYKIILSENINNLHSLSYRIINHFIIEKGIGLIFNNDSNINEMPINIFLNIFYFYRYTYDELCTFELRYKNDYREIILYDKCKDLETMHFILEEMGISFPINELFVKDEESTYVFRFKGKEDSEYIVFGKDLIELMDLDINDKNFNINNKNFITNFDE